MANDYFTKWVEVAMGAKGEYTLANWIGAKKKWSQHLD